MGRKHSFEKSGGWKKRIGLTAQSPQMYCRCLVPAGFRGSVSGRGSIVCINCRLLVNVTQES
jgi:hypothetical protein